MNKYYSRSRDRSQILRLRRSSDDKLQYSLRGEGQLLQSISDRAPLQEVLNGICTALDCQIGNVVSLISLPGDEMTNLAETARIAALFGLYSFCSAGIVAEDCKLLGSLEMYCCVPRSPSPREFQLIERATCLAAIAINGRKEAGLHGSCGIHGNRPVQGRVLEWPVSMN